MSSEKAKLAVVALDNEIQRNLTDYLNEIFGGVVDITSFNVHNTKGPIYDYPIVLTSSTIWVDDAKQIFPLSEIIPGHRIINGLNLEKVILLPKNKKVLVASSFKYVSVETIKSLIDLGIDHVEYVPYGANDVINLQDFDTAITPGLSQFCPKGIKTIIDIGPRIIDVITFLDLLSKLKLDVSYLTRFVNYYTKLLMHSSQKLANIFSKSELLRKERDIILDTMDEGIITVNEDNRLSLINPSAAKIFNISIEQIIGTDATKFFQRLGFPNELKDASTRKPILDTIVNSQGKDIVCNEIPIVDDERKYHIYMFKEVSQLQKLENEVRRKLNTKGYIAKYNFSDIWGKNEKMMFVKERAKTFADTENTILITGESGTGKELFAQAIHLNSRRRNGPFLAINFASITESLVESELFGYEGGAFTGAKRDGKLGLFEQAHGGTLFLDEIGDSPLCIQARLLRVLQEKEIMKVGGDKVIPVNVRVIAATNKDLAECVEKNLFRADLYYRLNVLSIETPPLREHKEDIFLYLNRYISSKYRIDIEFSEKIKETLLAYNWPGNVRELINIADFIYYSAKGRNIIESKDIPMYMKKAIEKYETTNNDKKSLTIQNKDEIEIIYKIIDIINNTKTGSLGRPKLKDELMKRNIKMTDYAIKKYLEHLDSMGFIVTGKTKQGTKLTRKGIQILIDMNKNSG